MLALLASVGGFIPGLFGKSVSPKIAKALGGVILLVLLVAILSLGKCAYDRSVINQHDAEVRAESAEKQLEADRQADAETAAKAAKLDETEKKLDEATRDAAKADPAGAAGKVGPVTESYYETLRKEQRR